MIAYGEGVLEVDVEAVKIQHGIYNCQIQTRDRPRRLLGYRARLFNYEGELSAIDWTSGWRRSPGALKMTHKHVPGLGEQASMRRSSRRRKLVKTVMAEIERVARNVKYKFCILHTLFERNPFLLRFRTDQTMYYSPALTNVS